VIVDNEGGARAAVEHLIGHGRRRIAHLGGLSGAPGADERRQGWEAALTEAGLPADDSLLAHSDYSRSAGREAALGLLSTEELPDAVFVASDAQALGLLAAARERGLLVPDDLALVSFDGTDDAVFSDPPLTAVEQPIHDIAKTALRAVLQPEAGPLHERVGVRLVIRESCGPHNA
jgi:LacI family transcriptional regulator